MKCDLCLELNITQLLLLHWILVVPFGCVELFLWSQLVVHRWMFSKNVWIFDFTQLDEATRIVGLSLKLATLTFGFIAILLVLKLVWDALTHRQIMERSLRTGLQIVALEHVYVVLTTSVDIIWNFAISRLYWLFAKIGLNWFLMLFDGFSSIFRQLGCLLGSIYHLGDVNLLHVDIDETTALLLLL